MLTSKSYVLLAATSSFFLNTVHAVMTSRRRKAASIPYPNSYATKEQADKDPKAFSFNCGMAPPSLPSFFLLLRVASTDAAVLTALDER